VKPSLKLGNGVSPKVREPYLEARGYWAAASTQLSVAANTDRDRDHLIVQLSDPTTLVSKLELRIAARGKAQRLRFEIPAAPVTRFVLPAAVRGQSFEYTLRALDRFGNVLAERGTETEPELVHSDSREAGTSERAAATPAQGRSYFLPIALGVAGLSAVTAGVVFQIKRENAAQAWNSASCEHPGQTRLQQCQDVDDRRQQYEHLAIGFYAAGGALLTGSVLSLVLGRPAANAAPHAGLLGCALLGTGVSCDGQF